MVTDVQWLWWQGLGSHRAWMVEAFSYSFRPSAIDLATESKNSWVMWPPMEEMNIRLFTSIWMALFYYQHKGDHQTVVHHPSIWEDHIRGRYKTAHTDYKSSHSNWKLCLKIYKMGQKQYYTRLGHGHFNFLFIYYFFLFYRYWEWFWGVSKEKVFERKPHTVEEQKEFITQAFIDINT